MRPNPNVIAVILAVLFAAICSHLGYVGQDTLLTPDDLTALSAQPGLQRLVAYALIAGLALSLLWKSRSRPRPHFTTLTWMLCYLSYCGLSVLWSQGLWHSASRYLGLLAYSGLALGLALNYNWAELRQILLRSSGLTLTGVWLVELAALAKTQELPSRLSGPFHPNLSGALCAVLVVLLTPRWAESRASKLATSFCVLSLLATGSRAALAACLLGLVTQYLLRRQSETLTDLKQGLALTALGATALGLGLFLRYVPGLPLGGRLKLWSLLLNDLAERPILGYGYEGYFLPHQVEKLWEQLYWAVPSAHSWGLEALLGTGAVGLTLALGTLLSGTLALLRETSPERWDALALLTVATALSLVESTYLKPYSLYGLLTLSLLLKASSGNQEPLLRTPLLSQLQLLATSTLTLCLLANHGNLYYSAFPYNTLSVETLSAHLNSGTINKYLAYIGLTLLALLLFSVNSERPRLFVPARFRFLAPPFLLAASSLLWSVDFRLGLRRLALLGIVSLVALSLNRFFTEEQRLRVFRNVGLGLTGVGLLVELGLGTFEPLRHGYRFCGVFHPNHQAMTLVVVMLSSVLLVRRTPSSQLPFLLFATAMLTLTGGRFSTFSLLCVLCLLLFIRTLRLDEVSRISYLIVGSFSALAFLLAVRAPSLNGRGPLWQLLGQDFLKRPFLGWGYGSYWNPETVTRYSQKLAWTVPHAHSAYLDTLLSLGILGGCLAFVWLAKRLSDSLSKLSTLQGATLFLALLYLLLSSLTESWAVLPNNLLGLFTLTWLFSQNEDVQLSETGLKTEFLATALAATALFLSFAQRVAVP